MKMVVYFQCEGERNAVKLQMTANAIALMARSLSFDSDFMSPFSVNARKNNINTTGKSQSFNFSATPSVCLRFVGSFFRIVFPQKFRCSFALISLSTDLRLSNDFFSSFLLHLFFSIRDDLITA